MTLWERALVAFCYAFWRAYFEIRAEVRTIYKEKPTDEDIARLARIRDAIRRLRTEGNGGARLDGASPAIPAGGSVPPPGKT